MYDDDIEYTDEQCPKCGEYDVRSQYCIVTGCDDGYIDEYDDDAINFSPGQEFRVCEECRGRGFVRWCAKCGWDMNKEQADAE